jgi:hypothetical protein
MPIISVYTFKNRLEIQQIVAAIDKKKSESAWFTAKESRYSKTEVFIQYWYYEDVETALNHRMSEEDVYEIVSFLKNNGKAKVLKRTYCFINSFLKTLEIYRGCDKKTSEIVSFLEKLLKVKFEPLTLRPQQLKRIYSEYATELKQVMFKGVDGLVYDVLKADFLEKNEKFKQYLQNYPENLKAITFRPKINFLNGKNRYQVTINGDKGTIRLSSNEVFRWRPRFEIRQLVFILASAASSVTP